MESTSALVVVAVGRRGPATALEYAALEAVRLGHGLHLVHAVDQAPTGAVSDAAHFADLVREGTNVLTTATDVATALVAGRVPVTSTLEMSPAVAAVVTAAEGDATLVVVGRCPESSRTHPYVRSVTGGVAARVHASVVSVPDGWVDVASSPHVVVGVDDTDDSDDVLLEAFAAARARHARLTVISTWWRPPGSDHRALTHVDNPAWPEALRLGIEQAIVDLRAAYPDVPVEVEVRNARPGEVLIEASSDATLLVVGRHDPLVATGSHLGPVARSVLREAHCPVLLAAPRHAHHVRGRARTHAQHA